MCFDVGVFKTAWETAPVGTEEEHGNYSLGIFFKVVLFLQLGEEMSCFCS